MVRIICRGATLKVVPVSATYGLLDSVSILAPELIIYWGIAGRSEAVKRID